MNPDTILITGASGFVGRLLAQAEIENGNKVIGIHDPSESPQLEFESQGLDIRDTSKLQNFIAELKPRKTYHLAAISSVRMCQENPSLCFDVNVTGTLNLLDASSKLKAKPKVLFTSSCEVYGRVDPADLPIGEDAKPYPINIYGLSKLTAEGICRFYMREFGLPIVITRAFNHTGPGQAEGFVFPHVASALARKNSPILKLGNLSVIRDVLDARDVVRAYMKVMDRGKPGSVYNVASGRLISIEQGVRMLIEISGLSVKIAQEESRMRAYDIPQLTGDASRIEKDLGWRAEITLEQTFKDLLRYWRAKEGIS